MAKKKKTNDCARRREGGGEMQAGNPSSVGNLVERDKTGREEDWWWWCGNSNYRPRHLHLAGLDWQFKSANFNAGGIKFRHEHLIPQNDLKNK
jgi:hypothetical protein